MRDPVGVANVKGVMNMPFIQYLHEGSYVHHIGHLIYPEVRPSPIRNLFGKGKWKVVAEHWIGLIDDDENEECIASGFETQEEAETWLQERIQTFQIGGERTQR